MTNSSQANPLDRLFVNQKVDLELLARTILPFVQLYSASDGAGEILFTKAWDELNLKGKILAYLLGRKALAISGRVKDYDEGASPSQIETETELKGGSIRPTLSTLVDEKLVRVTQLEGERKYAIPDHVLPKIHEQLARGEDSI